MGKMFLFFLTEEREENKDQNASVYVIIEGKSRYGREGLNEDKKGKLQSGKREAVIKRDRADSLDGGEGRLDIHSTLQHQESTHQRRRP